MRRYHCPAFAAFFLFAFASAASAAGPSAPMTPYNWTGWYVGLNAGGNWGRSQTSTTVGPGAGGTSFGAPAVSGINSIGAPTNFDTDGFTGGIQGGYNYQIGQWLLGVEADFEYFRSAGSNSVTGVVVPGFPGIIATSVSTDWLFTVRPRLGVILNDWLVYGTGGLAVTELKATWNFVEVFASTAENASASVTKAGWTVGGGVETMLPGKWAIGAEYLYVQFDSASANSFAVNGVGVTLTNTFSHSTDLASSIVRFRLSKHF